MYSGSIPPILSFFCHSGTFSSIRKAIPTISSQLWSPQLKPVQNHKCFRALPSVQFVGDPNMCAEDPVNLYSQYLFSLLLKTRQREFWPCSLNKYIYPYPRPTILSKKINKCKKTNILWNWKQVHENKKTPTLIFSFLLRAEGTFVTKSAEISCHVGQLLWCHIHQSATARKWLHLGGLVGQRSRQVDKSLGKGAGRMEKLEVGTSCRGRKGSMYYIYHIRVTSIYKTVYNMYIISISLYFYSHAPSRKK